MRAECRPIFRRFLHDRRGNVAVIFAICCVPLITFIGTAIDYSRATQVRAKLQGAADAASVGALAKASPGFVAAGSMTTDGTITVGVNDAQKIFDANRANLTGYTLNSVTPTVVKTGSTINSTVSFTATINTMFLGLIGKTTLTMSGTSASTANMPLYVDFYLLLDNSPSMGVAATPADITNLQGKTGGCAFACHDTTKAAGTSNYDIAKANGITTRIDVVRQASANLMDTAQSTQTYSNQFRMAIYDFGASSATIGLRNLFALSSSLSSAKTAAGNIDLMAVAGQNDVYTIDKDTPFTTIFPAINSAIASPGAGTSASPLKYLFFVSDGVADEANSGLTMCSVSSSSYPLASSNRCQSPINPALCTTIKNRGIKIAVLYTTYQPPIDGWYNTWISPFNPGPWGPSPNSKIAQNMESCASPGFYFEVSPTQGISEAMNALFKKALADARISG